MRIGKNPTKDEQIPKSNYYHQVVIPVYLPNNEGYFKDGFKILQICLTSLFKTVHPNTYITVVNNGSSKRVIEYLDVLFKEGKIHEVIHTSSIGKINAVLKGITGQNFPLVTISDADVFFLNEWQQATYTIFKTFPKTGAVCTTPSPKSFKYLNHNIFYDKFWSKNLKFKKVKNKAALQQFAISIENPNFYNSSQLENILTLEKENVVAVIGAGHFVATYRKEIFKNLKRRYASFKLGGETEKQFLDIPVINTDLWRLSTYENYTYHMGNVFEEWMEKELQSLEESKNNRNFTLAKINTNKMSVYIKNKMFAKLFKFRSFFLWLLVQKGLSKKDVKNYFN